MESPTAEVSLSGTGRPDPWRSAFASSLVPGLGQWQNGRRKLGVALVTSFVLVPPLVLALLWTPAPAMVLVAVFALALIGWIASVVHAYRSAPRREGGPTAWKPAFWSHTVPGLGQLLERRWGIGIGLLLAWLILGVPLPEPWSSLVVTALALAGVVDALRSSRLGAVPTSEARPLLVLMVVLAFTALLASLGLRALVVQAFRTPSHGMEPTLRVGDFFFIDKTRAGRAQRGDVVVFPSPQDRTREFVKRVVATAGETVEIRDKHVFVDGRPLAEPYVTHSDPDTRPGGLDSRDNFGPFVVPSGQVFVLGDSRDNSNDSRYFGTVAVRDVRGRAFRAYWPPDANDRLRRTLP